MNPSDAATLVIVVTASVTVTAVNLLVQRESFKVRRPCYVRTDHYDRVNKSVPSKEDRQIGTLPERR